MIEERKKGHSKSLKRRRIQKKNGEDALGIVYFIHFNRKADRKCGQRCGDTGKLVLGRKHLLALILRLPFPQYRTECGWGEAKGISDFFHNLLIEVKGRFPVDEIIFIAIIKESTKCTHFSVA